MKKKQYSYPQVEVVRINTLLMQAFGEASKPSDAFSGAPQRAPELSNDSVRVF